MDSYLLIYSVNKSELLISTQIIENIIDILIYDVKVYIFFSIRAF